MEGTFAVARGSEGTDWEYCFHFWSLPNPVELGADVENNKTGGCWTMHFCQEWLSETLQSPMTPSRQPFKALVRHAWPDFASVRLIHPGNIWSFRGGLVGLQGP